MKAKKFFVAAITILGLSLAPLPVAAAPCQDRLLTFPTWYRGIGVTEGNTCRIELRRSNNLSALSRNLTLILLNLIEVGIQITAYVATGFVIWGGFRYIKSEGDPTRLQEARKTIVQALTGLAIALMAVGIVNFVASRIN